MITPGKTPPQGFKSDIHRPEKGTVQSLKPPAKQIHFSPGKTE
jgi:hypothetical protein